MMLHKSSKYNANMAHMFISKLKRIWKRHIGHFTTESKLIILELVLL